MAHTPRQISASQIRPGATIILRGQIEYARVRSLLGPADIEKLNRARTKSEPLDVNKPITRLALHHAEVVPQAPDGQMTPEEYYVWERMFETPDKPELGRRWSIDNKGTVLPVLLKAVDGTAHQITDDEIPASPTSLPTEPERDQLITVVLNVYDTKRVNKGIGIQAIIFNEEPRWYTGSSSVNNTALAALGITLSGPISLTAALSQTSLKPPLLLRLRLLLHPLFPPFLLSRLFRRQHLRTPWLTQPLAWQCPRLSPSLLHLLRLLRLQRLIPRRSRL